MEDNEYEQLDPISWVLLRPDAMIGSNVNNET